MKRKLVIAYWLFLGLLSTCSELTNAVGLPIFSLPDIKKPAYESEKGSSDTLTEEETSDPFELTYDEEALKEIVLDFLEEPLYENESASEKISLHEVFLVHVVDGDTIIISDNGVERKVRLIGIDAAESVHSDDSKNSVYGDFASEYTKNLLSDSNTVYLQYDVDTSDDFERVLAYVWLKDDVDIYEKNDIENYMVNAILLNKGYAFAKTYEPNILYSDYFSELCNNAAEADTGLWKYEEFEQLWQ